MTYVAVSGLFIHSLRLVGPFSPIHLLSLYTVFLLAYGVILVRRGRISAHRCDDDRPLLVRPRGGGCLHLFPGARHVAGGDGRMTEAHAAPTLLSIGHGYSARALGQRLVADGWRVIGTARAPREEPGVEMRVWPGDDLGDAIAEAQCILTSVAPGPEGDPVLPALGEAIAACAGGMGRLPLHHRRLRRPRRRLGRRGDAPRPGDRARPPAGRGRGGLAGCRRAPPHLPPRRHLRPRARAVREGAQRPGATHRQAGAGLQPHPCRGHRAGAAASIGAPGSRRSTTLADDEPAPPQDVIAYAAELLGAPLPPEVAFDEADLSPMARSFYAESETGTERQGQGPARTPPALPDLPRGAGGHPRGRADLRRTVTHPRHRNRRLSGKQDASDRELV